MRFALAVLSGCAWHTVEVTAASGVIEDRPEWVVTRPALVGADHVTAASGAVYVLDCGVALHLTRLAGGAVDWAKVVEAKCFSLGDHIRPIVAGADGVVIAAAEELGKGGGVRIVAVDPAGKPRWARVIAGETRGIALAASADRLAVCFDSSSPIALDGGPLGAGRTSYAIELDHAGKLLATHVLDAGWFPADCSYDEDGELWSIVHWASGKPIHVAGRERPLPAGTWAIRRSGAPRFARLFSWADGAQVLAMPSGFIVEEPRAGAISFVGLDGQRAWRIAGDDKGCKFYPRPIAADPTRLVAASPILCDQRGGTASFGEVSVHDETELPDDPLGQRTIVVDLTMPSGHPRAVLDLPHAPSGAYVLDGRHLVVSGGFSGALGLGTEIRSGPRTYSCNSDLPEDADTWDSYSSKTWRCKPGHHAVPEDPSWPYVATFALP